MYATDPNTFIITRVAHYDGIRVTETDYFQVVGKGDDAVELALSQAVSKFNYWVANGSRDLPLSDEGWVELQPYCDDEPISGIIANNVGQNLSIAETTEAYYCGEVYGQVYKCIEVREDKHLNTAFTDLLGMYRLLRA